MVKVILVALAVIVFMAMSAVIGFFGGISYAAYIVAEKYRKTAEEFEAYDSENCEHREIGFLASWRNEPTLK